jgi:hypothetical protein
MADHREAPETGVKHAYRPVIHGSQLPTAVS